MPYAPDLSLSGRLRQHVALFAELDNCIPLLGDNSNEARLGSGHSMSSGACKPLYGRLWVGLGFARKPLLRTAGGPPFLAR
jgi:hypothetical protein